MEAQAAHPPCLSQSLGVICSPAMTSPKAGQQNTGAGEEGKQQPQPSFLQVSACPASPQRFAIPPPSPSKLEAALKWTRDHVPPCSQPSTGCPHCSQVLGPYTSLDTSSAPLSCFLTTVRPPGPFCCSSNSHGSDLPQGLLHFRWLLPRLQLANSTPCPSLSIPLPSPPISSIPAAFLTSLCQ